MDPILCKKHYILNNGRYVLSDSLKATLITHCQGIQAGGQTERDLMPCPKEAKDQETCLKCQFSVVVKRSIDDFDI